MTDIHDLKQPFFLFPSFDLIGNFFIEIALNDKPSYYSSLMSKSFLLHFNKC